MRHLTSATRLLLFLLICAAADAYGADLHGRVVEVPAANIIAVQNGNTAFKVRLVTVRPPRGKHPLKEVARKHLSDLLSGKSVSVKPLGLKADTLIGFVFHEGNDVGVQMIRDGAAWYDAAYAGRMDAPAHSLYEQAQQAARDEKRGVWDESVVAAAAAVGGEAGAQQPAPQVQRPAPPRPRLKPESAAEKARRLNDAGYSLIKQEQYGAAYPLVAQAALLDPSNADARKNLCAIFYEARRLEEALAQCAEAIRLRPDFDKAYLNAGLTLHLMGKKEEALRAYRQAIRINPRYAKAHHNLGWLLFDTGRYQESVASYLRAEEFGVEDQVKLDLNLGLALYRLGRKREARARWQRVLATGDEGGAAAAREGLKLP